MRERFSGAAFFGGGEERPSRRAMTSSKPPLAVGRFCRSIVVIANSCPAKLCDVGGKRHKIGLPRIMSSPTGVLTTLPLLAFGAISPFAALIARKYGLERSLFGALILIGGGIVLRSIGPAWCLYVGTAVIGCGIAIGNV